MERGYASQTSTTGVIKNVDYILEKHVGGIGRWQFWNSVKVLLVHYASLYPLFITVFTTYAPDHRFDHFSESRIFLFFIVFSRCHVQNCDASNATVQPYPGPSDQEWISFAIPTQVSSSNFLSEKKTFDQCSMYKVNM